MLVFRPVHPIGQGNRGEKRLRQSGHCDALRRATTFWEIMSSLTWYWNRLRAMGPSEIAAHVRRKFFQWSDERALPDWSSGHLETATPSAYPRLPPIDSAPPQLREALHRDASDILGGRWKAFGHLELKVDDPPRWQTDYLLGRDVETDEGAFKLNHRELPHGADIKLVWELSRWHQLARLAQAAYVLGEGRAARKCVEWLEDWVRHNPAYRGWNWTSALEVGIRLVQITSIDALLKGHLQGAGTSLRATGEFPSPRPSPQGAGDAIGASGQARPSAWPGPLSVGRPRPGGEGRGEGKTAETPSLSLKLGRVVGEILPAHAWYAWRYRSFGSSANNHLIGELAGLILAIARWPELARWAASLDALQQLWEGEVLAQFAEDGGNREQALNYHWFSWELCWLARAALVAAGRQISSEAEMRLHRAARFFWEVQVRQEPWDYGDSDNAFATPFFVAERTALIEWHDWLSRPTPNAGTSLDYWLGDPPKFSPPLGRGNPAHAVATKGWWIYRETGIAICESGFWWLRWDLSALGYLNTAAHGHLDALHLSVWFKGVAMVIDPGTGAYYADEGLRAWLASREAHNGPSPKVWSDPVRLGPFLWSSHHKLPRWEADKEGGIVGQWDLANGRMRRRVLRLEGRDGWQVDDAYESRSGTSDFTVRWQFAPGSLVKLLDERRFSIKRESQSVLVEAGSEWAEVVLVERKSQSLPDTALTTGVEARYAGTVSPAFRRVEWAPFLNLVARPRAGKPCVFRTTFLACGEV